MMYLIFPVVLPVAVRFMHHVTKDNNQVLNLDSSNQVCGWRHAHLLAGKNIINAAEGLLVCFVDKFIDSFWRCR